jgi:thiol-disulfide isomerase/thioredoxin
MWQLLFALLLALQQTQGARDISTAASTTPTGHPILSLGSSAPDFSLPGVDGKTHTLADYAAPILVVVFTCNHCPIAQMYEQRIQQLEADYHARGVAVVAIEPNDPKALRIDELDSSDISDSLDEMKIRFEYKNLHYPYLYDGETQLVTRAYGPQATPHVFIFDKDRKLRYEGRMDNSYRKEMVNTQDARNAIDALLANREVVVKRGDAAKNRCGAGKAGNGHGRGPKASPRQFL